MNFNKVWAPVASVIEHNNLEYAEAVTIGSQFGKMHDEIKRLERKLEDYERYQNALKKIADKSDVDFGNSYANKVYMHNIKLAREALDQSTD